MKNKVRELKQILSSGISIQSLSELGLDREIEETGATIGENSELKATAIFTELAVPIIADDSGLEVDVLCGEPGVRSARYAGEEKSNEANITKLLNELSGSEQRGAQFKTVITLKTNSGLYQFTGIVRGKIITEKRGEEGFGYDPIFIPEGEDKTFAEMSAAEKNAISHRSIAVKKLLTYLRSSI